MICVNCGGDDQDCQRLLLERTVTAVTGTLDDLARSAHRYVTGGGRETRGPECVDTQGQ